MDHKSVGVQQIFKLEKNIFKKSGVGIESKVDSEWLIFGGFVSPWLNDQWNPTSSAWEIATPRESNCSLLHSKHLWNYVGKIIYVLFYERKLFCNRFISMYNISSQTKSASKCWADSAVWQLAMETERTIMATWHENLSVTLCCPLT